MASESVTFHLLPAPHQAQGQGARGLESRPSAISVFPPHWHHPGFSLSMRIPEQWEAEPCLLHQWPQMPDRLFCSGHTASARSSLRLLRSPPLSSLGAPQSPSARTPTSVTRLQWSPAQLRQFEELTKDSQTQRSLSPTCPWSEISPWASLIASTPEEGKCPRGETLCQEELWQELALGAWQPGDISLQSYGRFAT